MAYTVVSAIAIVFGLLGSLIMFLNGHVLKPYPAGMFAPDNYEEIDKQITKDNRRIVVMQRLGMLCLCVSFALQGAALCIST
ncbi:hypothetical protein DSL62_08855 [Pantoea sp. 3_1284]|nr:hypothetical protein DSL62_08855 [Pantoea sp. 3_1284]